MPTSTTTLPTTTTTLPPTTAAVTITTSIFLNNQTYENSDNSILENTNYNLLFTNNTLKVCNKNNNECNIIYKYNGSNTILLILHKEGYISILNKDTNDILWTTQTNQEPFFNVSNNLNFSIKLTENGNLQIVDNNNNIVWSYLSMVTTTTPYTTQPVLNDVTQLFPNISSDTIISLLNSGVDLMKLYSDTNYMSEKGMNFDSQMRGPSTNIYQKNFSGTSNVYSPYLYYNKNSNENELQ